MLERGRRAIRRRAEEIPIARIRRAIELKHRANLGEEAETCAFAEGDAVEILKEWQGHYLCKDEMGRLFNIPKERVEAD